MSLSLRIPAVLAVVTLAACQEVPTSPEHVLAPPDNRQLALNYTPDIATINSVTCDIADPTFPDVACSFSITNPQSGDLHLSIQAMMQYTYECFNPKTLRVSSSVTVQEFWTYREQTLTPGTNSESGWYLPHTPTLPENSFIGKDKKRNACKGNDSVRFSSSRIDYLYVGVFELPQLDGNYTCKESDNRFSQNCGSL